MIKTAHDCLDTGVHLKRAAFENLILLCQKHHTVTDDVATYTVEVMKQMKANHEAKFAAANFKVSDNAALKALSEINRSITQRGSGQNIAVQNGNITVINQSGMTFSEAERIFMLLFQENFPKLLDAARDVAETRAREFYAEFAKRGTQEGLSEQDLAGLTEPAVQASVATATTNAARQRDEAMRRDLAGLVVKQLKHSADDLKAIVFREAIGVVARLTPNQMRIMSLRFMLVDARSSTARTVHAVATYLARLEQNLLPVRITNGEMQHISYAGGGEFNKFFHFDIGRLFREIYGTAFLSAITLEDLTEFSPDVVAALGQVATVAPTAVLFRVQNMDELRQKLANFPGGVSDSIVALYERKLGNVLEILEKESPSFRKILPLWQAGIGNLSLTPVGKAIAVTHLETTCGYRLDRLDPDSWIA